MISLAGGVWDGTGIHKQILNIFTIMYFYHYVFVKKYWTFNKIVKDLLHTDIKIFGTNPYIFVHKSVLWHFLMNLKCFLFELQNVCNKKKFQQNL